MTCISNHINHRLQVRASCTNESDVEIVQKISNGLPCLTMEITFRTHAIQAMLGTNLWAWREKNEYIATSSAQINRNQEEEDHGCNIWFWIWVWFWGMHGKLRPSIENSREGGDKGVTKEVWQHPRFSISAFILVFLVVLMAKLDCLVTSWSIFLQGPMSWLENQARW